MKAVVVESPGKIVVRDVPAPEPGDYDALVRMEACGVCNSTDVKLVDGKMFWAPPFPFVLGHESVGAVLEVGPRVRRFKAGDRVTRPMAFWPGSRADLNVANGGMAEYGIVRDVAAMAADGDASLAADYNAVRQMVVPPHLSPLDAAVAISLAETASVLRRLPNPRGLRVVVAGTGAVGMAFTLWLKIAGAFVITLGRRPRRLKAALQFGADAVVSAADEGFLDAIIKAAGGRVDGLIEATGDAELAARLLDVLKEDGFASAYGIPPAGVSYGARWTPSVVEEHLDFAWVADLMRREWVMTDWLLDHRWKLAAAPQAFEQVRRGEVLKGVIVF